MCCAFAALTIFPAVFGFVTSAAIAVVSPMFIAVTTVFLFGVVAAFIGAMTAFGRAVVIVISVLSPWDRVCALGHDRACSHQNAQDCDGKQHLFHVYFFVW